nr:unnamed protein product [Leishmania braziliensis]
MSDKQERLTEAELDRTLKVYLAHKATRSMAEIAKKQYMEGKTNTSEFLEMTAAMADSLWEKAGEKGAPSIDVKKEMMEAHNIFADKELQEVMDMEEKRKETRAKIKATKDPLEGYKTKVESAILANQMSPMAAATATILLGLSGPESQEMSADERIAEWLSIFVDETCSSRLLAFNVQVAESVAGGMRQWRKVLKRLDAPLVPETERLAHLNRITLEAAENEKQRSTTQRIEGGGTHTTRPRDIFRTPPRDGSDLLEGGAPYAPIIGADGSQVAALDMSSFGALTEESQLRMQDTITHLMREQKTAPRVSNHTQGPRNSQNSGRGVGFQGNYRGNGGGNRHGNYRGGEAQEDFPSESKNLKPDGTTADVSRKEPTHHRTITCGVARSFAKEVWGGDMRAGKTSNMELDAIYNAYLPKKRIVPSDTMVHLDWKRAQQLAAKVHRHGVVYFPIFIMKHWIAGLLEKGTRDSAEIQLSIFDSAPSPIVEDKLRKHFHMVWPALRLVNEFSPRQERYSDDCGLYMSAVFFGDHLDIQIDHSQDMAKCMRRLLYAASKHHPPREYFLEKMRKILTNHPVSRKDRFYDEIEHKPWLKKTTVNREDTFHLGGGERRTTKFTNPKRDSKRANKTSTRAPHPPLHQKKEEVTVRTSRDRIERKKGAPPTRVAASKTPSRKRPERSAMDAPLPRRKAAKNSVRKTPPRTSARRNGNNTRSVRSSGFPSPRAEVSQRCVSVTHAPPTENVEGKNTTNASPHVPQGKCISEWTELTFSEANKYAKKVYEAVLDHLWAATALARVGDGVARGLSDTAVGQQRVRHKMTPLRPYSVQEMLKLLGKTIHIAEASPSDLGEVIVREEHQLEEVTLDPSTDELYLVRGASVPTLSEEVKGYKFLLGASLREAPEDMNGARYPSYYVLTKDASEATVGVYVPTALTHYNPSKRQRAPRHALRYVPLPRSAASEAHQDHTNGPRPRLVRRKGWPDDGAGNQLGDDEEDGGPYSVPGNRKGDGYADVDANISAEATRALEDLRSNPLNMQGRPLSQEEEAEVCPRNWFLFAAKPPHISQLAWSLVRPDTRAHHLRWLTRIKSMNSEQMLMRFPAACIDLILSTARARKWKWATTAKAFAAVAGALRDLPLYSTQARGIRLQDDPEWRSAFGTVQRYMKESVPDAPPFVSRRQVEAIIGRLRLGHPRAALFLAMMWGFAARACDISTLRAKDVTLFPGPPTSTRVKVTLTIRKGKGAKTRGPYPVPSMLTRDLAATLQEMLVQKKPSEELFAPHVEELRALIAQEVRTEMRGAQLPSIRKGALRCMAEAGVPLKDLMMISGHAKQATLLRYLGYGQQPTVEAETARDNAGRALFQTL